eukprot:TRINITY_DN10440_c0_g1_i2.p1 TRINITY_DN10440_c0_g1~~TRINITY_DN10440_c0_g1_i2.p1  ORF type:complete len:706 (+),score=72.49 TRINITY_DN10440_c0_g1_i2:300-2120(+)
MLTTATEEADAAVAPPRAAELDDQEPAAGPEALLGCPGADPQQSIGADPLGLPHQADTSHATDSSQPALPGADDPPPRVRTPEGPPTDSAAAGMLLSPRHDLEPPDSEGQRSAFTPLRPSPVAKPRRVSHAYSASSVGSVTDPGGAEEAEQHARPAQSAPPASSAVVASSLLSLDPVYAPALCASAEETDDQRRLSATVEAPAPVVSFVDGDTGGTVCFVAAPGGGVLCPLSPVAARWFIHQPPHTICWPDAGEGTCSLPHSGSSRAEAVRALIQLAERCGVEHNLEGVDVDVPSRQDHAAGRGRCSPTRSPPRSPPRSPRARDLAVGSTASGLQSLPQLAPAELEEVKQRLGGVQPRLMEWEAKQARQRKQQEEELLRSPQRQRPTRPRFDTSPPRRGKASVDKARPAFPDPPPLQRFSSPRAVRSRLMDWDTKQRQHRRRCLTPPRCPPAAWLPHWSGGGSLPPSVQRACLSGTTTPRRTGTPRSSRSPGRPVCSDPAESSRSAPGAVPCTRSDMARLRADNAALLRALEHLRSAPRPASSELRLRLSSPECGSSSGEPSAFQKMVLQYASEQGLPVRGPPRRAPPCSSARLGPAGVWPVRSRE